MSTPRRHPMNKRIPDRRRPAPAPTADQLAVQLGILAAAVQPVAVALERFAEQVGFALTEWQRNVLARLYPPTPPTRDDYTLTR